MTLKRSVEQMRLRKVDGWRRIAAVLNQRIAVSDADLQKIAVTKLPGRRHMSDRHGLSRREILGIGVAASGLAVSGGLTGAFAQALKRTPGEILGPFYPVLKTVDRGADLTTIVGKQGRAEGQVIHVMGRVINVEGQPVKGARVELWQANTHGRYTHPSDTNPAALDPNFEGFAVQNTDAEGRYRFKTIKPGAYPATANWMRPPHLHFEVTGKINRMITQMYFPGEPLNDKDILLQNIRANKEGLMAKVLPPTSDVEPDSRIVVWDIVIDKG
jgi:protocatechuate 3,4-dioxygenase beta subunit